MNKRAPTGNIDRIDRNKDDLRSSRVIGNNLTNVDFRRASRDHFDAVDARVTAEIPYIFHRLDITLPKIARTSSRISPESHPFT